MASTLDLTADGDRHRPADQWTAVRQDWMENDGWCNGCERSVCWCGTEEEREDYDRRIEERIEEHERKMHYL